MQTIRELREAKGWTQLDLAFRVGVTLSTISNWERGRYEPRLKQLRDLARVFEVSMDHIASVEQTPTEEPRKQPAA